MGARRPPPPPRGDRNWQQFQRQQHAPPAGPPRQPSPGYARGFVHPPPPLPPGGNAHAAPLTGAPRPSAGEIAAFVENFRVSRSHANAQPNALTLHAVVQAVCGHFGAYSVSLDCRPLN